METHPQTASESVPLCSSLAIPCLSEHPFHFVMTQPMSQWRFLSGGEHRNLAVGAQRQESPALTLGLRTTVDSHDNHEYWG